MTLRLLIALCVACITPVAQAMQMVPHVTEGGISILFATGDIVSGDTEMLTKLLDQGQVEDRIIILSSNGGDMFEALEMGRAIRYFGFTTFVLPDAVCYSACAYVFLGGEVRQIMPGASIGVHQFYGGSDSLQDQRGTQAVAGSVLEYLNAMDVDASVAAKAMTTPPDEMYVFSPQELDALRVTTSADKRRFAVREAERAGLATEEWLRRRKVYLSSKSLPKCYDHSDFFSHSVCLMAERGKAGIDR